MSTVNVPDALAQRLAAEAERRHTSVDDLVAGFVSAGLEQPVTGTQRRQLRFAAVGASGSRRGAAEAEELLAEGFGRD